MGGAPIPEGDEAPTPQISHDAPRSAPQGTPTAVIEGGAEFDNDDEPNFNRIDGVVASVEPSAARPEGGGSREGRPGGGGDRNRRRRGRGGRPGGGSGGHGGGHSGGGGRGKTVATVLSPSCQQIQRAAAMRPIFYFVLTNFRTTDA